MIDEKSRDEVIRLWKKGFTKTKIKEITGISLPSIRKIINTSDQDRDETLVDLYPVDKFIINTTRNWPYRSNPPLQCLRNGAPIWEIPLLLRPMYNEHVIKQIMQMIPEHPPFHVYQVSVEHRGNGREVVSVEILDRYSRG